jgi:DNA-damage-inducible protein D
MFSEKFELCCQTNDDQSEFWFARDLQSILNYKNWNDFKEVVLQAQITCKTSGFDIVQHFLDTDRTIKDKKHKVDDIMLSRYACYLIIQNSDSKKQEVAFAQNYFAMKTSLANLFDRNFASIRSKGDTALFGKSTQAMKAQWKVPDRRSLADFAPTIILKAKDFAAEITIFNAQQNQMTTEPEISSEHITNNQAVRKTLLERGIRPESLPPAEDVKKVERRLASDEKKSLKNPDVLEN